ncbi:MAG: DUF883 family protein [Acidobacteria bacterium]|nr:DUF883 family protein [Acidobacteriota bacterium]
MATNTADDGMAQAVDARIDAAREATGDRIGKLKEKAGEVADAAKARAAALRDKIRDTDWDDVTSNVTGYVRENPGKSVAIALGVGFVLGLLLRKKGHD